MKRVAVAVLAWAMLIVLPSITIHPPEAAAQVPAGQQPGHAIDTNEAGDVVIAAVKQTGRLYTRTLINGDWSSWQVQGRDTWVSADVTINELGEIALIGLKQSGALWTREATPDSGWGSWERQGRATWATDTIPAIDRDGDTTSFAAVKESGALYTRRRIAGAGWESWVEHGSRTWAHADIGVHDAGFAVLAGTKRDGRLYTRVVSPGRGQWELQGRPDWSTETPPSLSLYFNVLALGAVKADGRAYVRTGIYGSNGVFPEGQWDAFTPAVASDVANISVAASRSNVSFAFVGKSGELTSWALGGGSGNWELVPLRTFLGYSGWSASVPVSVASAPRSGATEAMLMVRPDGGLSMYTRVVGARQFVRLGRSTWASGPDINQATVARSEYPSGLHLVGPDALPAGRYEVESGSGDDCFWFRLSNISGQSFLDGLVGDGDVARGAVGIIDVLPSDGAVDVFRCATVRPYVAPASTSTSFGAGDYVVGSDIAPGRYVSSEGCSWGRLANFEGTRGSRLAIDPSIFDGQNIVDILDTDGGFTAYDGCAFSLYSAPSAPASEVGPGMYVVGDEIAPGRYVVSAGCGFGRVSNFEGYDSSFGDYLGLLGGFPTYSAVEEEGSWIVDIKSSDVGFVLNDMQQRRCEATPYVAPASPATVPTAGTNIIGVNLEPGAYTAPGGPRCFFAPLSGFGWGSADLPSGFLTSTGELTVSVTEAFYASSFCGEWTVADPVGIGALEVDNGVVLDSPPFTETAEVDAFDEQRFSVRDYQEDPLGHVEVAPDFDGAALD